MQLALDLVNRRKTKDQLIDDGFHRDSLLDKEGLPPWFLDDEMRHFRKHVPVTKEAVQALRDRMRALDARPIKKIAEAKGRKKLRALRRIEKLQNKANAVNDTGDMTEREKAGAIEKMMAKAMKAPKKKNEVKVVVARGAARGQKGRPRGVKGRYKVRHASYPDTCRRQHDTDVVIGADGGPARQEGDARTEAAGAGEEVVASVVASVSQSAQHCIVSFMGSDVCPNVCWCIHE